jgi:Predicted membrane protein
MTSSGMLFLEISLIAFMIQGNNASGVETLTRTFVVSGVIVCADLLLRVLIIVKKICE